MAQKNRDHHGRWRARTIAFRVSDKENAQIDRLAHMMGVTKQQYLTDNMLHHTIVVQGNPRVHKALRGEMRAIAEELKRLACASDVDDDFLSIVRTALAIYDGLKEV